MMPMAGLTRDSRTRSACLSQSLKSVRRLRGLRAADVAKAMGMSLRAYENFEAGRGRLDVERILQFAQVLQADGLAILIGMEMGMPDFALRTARNKLVTILAMAMQAFDEGVGDQIAQLDAQTLIRSFTGVFQTLADFALERQAFVERWMAESAAGRDTGTEPPGKSPAGGGDDGT